MRSASLCAVLQRMRNLARVLFSVMTMFAFTGEVRAMDLHEAARKGDMAEMNATNFPPDSPAKAGWGDWNW